MEGYGAITFEPNISFFFVQALPSGLLSQSHSLSFSADADRFLLAATGAPGTTLTARPATPEAGTSTAEAGTATTTASAACPPATAAATATATATTATVGTIPV